MTPEQIARVKESFVHVHAIKEAAADLFYDRLFTIAPQTRALFPDDLAEQKKKLMTAIAMVVGSLDRVDTILEAVRELGRRHGEYGVSAEDYETVGAALLWTLEQGLGELWSADLAEAWTAAYGALSTVMIAAADEDRAAA